jgi:Fic family protein
MPFFSSPYSALYALNNCKWENSPITTGSWRKDLKGPMQVVSGIIGKETIHFQAPAASLVEREMARFIEWFNREDNSEYIISSAIAHLWFVTVHPFEDGNGRIARALARQVIQEPPQVLQHVGPDQN